MNTPIKELLIKVQKRRVELVNTNHIKPFVLTAKLKEIDALTTLISKEFLNEKRFIIETYTYPDDLRGLNANMTKRERAEQFYKTLNK